MIHEIADIYALIRYTCSQLPKSARMESQCRHDVYLLSALARGFQSSLKKAAAEY